jgi:phosphoketolase
MRPRSLPENIEKKLAEHHDYGREHGEDMPEIRNWTWARG